MQKIKLLLSAEHLGNSGFNYLIFILAILLGFIFKGLISKYLSHSLYRVIGKRETRVGVDKFDQLLTKPIAFFIMISILYLGASQLEYPQEWNLVDANKFGLKMFINKVFSLIFIYSIFNFALNCFFINF